MVQDSMGPEEIHVGTERTKFVKLPAPLVPGSVKPPAGLQGGNKDSLYSSDDHPDACTKTSAASQVFVSS